LYSVEYGTTTISFDIVRKSNQKNTYINVDTNGVLVKTTSTSKIEEINDMVKSKASWIVKQLEKFSAISVNDDICTGSRLYYMGKSYYVNVLKDNTIDDICISFTHSKFNIATPLVYTKEQLNTAIEDFYRQKANEKIIPLSRKWSKLMDVCPEYISFRYSKKRWGSCSPTNRISFNYHLIKLSSSMIEYVVVHELAHIKYKNHSKEFWKFVYKYIPDYKVKEEKIRTFEKLI
jgi:predicted metal-dependent hydrolase